MLLGLPALPEEEQRERKNRKEDEALGIHVKH
jgi:hypothetical protein